MCVTLRANSTLIKWQSYETLLTRLPFSFLGPKGSLIIANRQDIRRISLNSTGYEIVVPDQKSVVGLDFDFKQQNLYWSDVVADTIQKASLNNEASVEVIVQDDLEAPEGLAVDWINQKLYWVDSGTRKIEVSDLDGRNRLPLVTSGLKNARDIVVHPFVG